MSPLYSAAELKPIKTVHSYTWPRPLLCVLTTPWSHLDGFTEWQTIDRTRGITTPEDIWMGSQRDKRLTGREECLVNTPSNRLNTLLLVYHKSSRCYTAHTLYSKFAQASFKNNFWHIKSYSLVLCLYSSQYGHHRTTCVGLRTKPVMKTTHKFHMREHPLVPSTEAISTLLNRDGSNAKKEKYSHVDGKYVHCP